jgi:hypothetical protein
MPAVQTSYDPAIAAAYAGMIAETQYKDAASRTVENATMGFGLAVGRGSADETARLDGSGFEGISIADKTQLDAEYAVGSVAGVLRKGTIWVTASTDVNPSDPVTFTAATGVIGAGLATTIEGAKFETTATSGNLVRVYLG